MGIRGYNMASMGLLVVSKLGSIVLYKIDRAERALTELVS